MKLAPLLLTLIIATLTTTAADQLQWGELYTRNMVSTETSLPTDFDPETGRNIRWTAELGTETYGSPSIANGRVYLGTNNGNPRDPRHRGDRGILLCLDEKTGTLLWQLVVPKIKTSVYWDWPGGGVCSTPTIEGDRIYVVSSRGEILCLDAHGMANGNDGPFTDELNYRTPEGSEPQATIDTDADIIWCYDTIKELDVRQHDAAHGSILLHGRFLYVNTSNGVDDTHRHIASPDAPSLIVLDKLTGRLVARDNEHIGPDTFHCTWSSPALATINGKTKIIYAAPNGIVYAFEPVTKITDQVQTLKKIWWYDSDPTAPKENIHQYVSNRRESPSTIHAMPVIVDDKIYIAGGGDIWWGKREAWLQCISLQGQGNTTTTGRHWHYPLNQHNLATPVVYDGMVFVADTGRHLHCVDAATGQPYWTQRVKGEVWATPLVADGKLYLATRGREVMVLAAKREKELLATITLDSPISSTPVAANKTLYFASNRRLYAVALQP